LARRVFYAKKDAKMAKGFRAEIKGDKEFYAKLQSMANQMSAVLDEASQAGADVVKDQANRLAPGPNIETDLARRTRYLAEQEIGPDDEFWYYRFFESGAQPHEITPSSQGGLEFKGLDGELIVRVVVDHQGMAAKPFLRPAFDEKKSQAEEATGKKFLEVINKHVERR
jgi:HK97 gp10 family phage protein